MGPEEVVGLVLAKKAPLRGREYERIGSRLTVTTRKGSWANAQPSDQTSNDRNRAR